MQPYLTDADFTLYQGDALDVLRELPDGSAHMCVTSPPFYGLRDYNTDGQIGLEETPDAYVARLVEVFREVRRVLRNDGTCWVEIGDSYNSGTTAKRNPTTTAEHGRWENGELGGEPWRTRPYYLTDSHNSTVSSSTGAATARTASSA